MSKGRGDMFALSWGLGLRKRVIDDSVCFGRMMG